MPEETPTRGRHYEPAGEIRRSDRPHLVFCPNCDRVIGEATVRPDLLNRYKCRHCNEWTWLMIVAAAVPVVDTAA